MKTLVLFFVSLHSLSLGCTTMTKSVSFGVGIGGAVGGGVTALAKNGEGKSVAIGAAVGAAVGAGFGYLAHRQQEKEELRLKLLSQKFQPAKKPKLLKPKIKMMWVPDSIDGNKFTQGHWMFRLEAPTGWSK